MTITLPALPSVVADALILRARQEGRTVQEVALDALSRGLEAQAAKTDPLDLLDPDSTWIETPAFQNALAEFARLDAQAA